MIPKTKAEVTITIEDLDPDKAQKWLDTSAGNRSIRQGHVRKIASAMAGGEFEFNGDTIRFDWNGKIIDGHHRCHSVIASGVTIKVIVVRGLAPQVFDTIDIGSARKASDALHGIGYSNCRDLAAAAGLIDSIQSGQFMGTSRLSPREIESIVTDNPGLNIFVSHYAASKAKRNGLLPVSILAAMHYLFRSTDPVLADMFMDGLISGENLKAGDPVLLLRDRLISNSTDKAKISKKYKIALIVKAWNHTRRGETVKNLRFRQEGDNPEKMPQIE